MVSRIVCHFSCGAASAVATKLILGQYDPARVVIFNAFIQEEHPDNRRFLSDCERWFNHPITVLRDEKYDASVHECWRRKRYIKNHFGSPCSGLLKREVMDAASLDGDMHVLGFTAEEADRAKRFTPPDGVVPSHIFPLIERNLSKQDCLAMVERAGIELPAMYRLGFNNANCIGCCKGGQGYWNHVRKVFPDVFWKASAIQEDIGPGAYIFYHRDTLVRFGLKDLDPNAGRHDEILPDCSFFCAMAEGEL